jgi:hypothetical protein
MLLNPWLVFIGLGCLWLIPPLLMLVFPKRFQKPAADEAAGMSASKQLSYVQIINRWDAPIMGASSIAAGLAMRFLPRVQIVPLLVLAIVATVHAWGRIRALMQDKGPWVNLQQQQTQPGQRPLGISILTGFVVLVTATSFLVTLILFGKGELPVQGLVASMLVYLLFLAFAFGAWTLRPWAWYLGVALVVWTLINPVIDLVNGELTVQQAVRLVILALILVYLFTPRIKAAFKKGQQVSS